MRISRSFSSRSVISRRLFASFPSPTFFPGAGPVGGAQADALASRYAYARRRRRWRDCIHPHGGGAGEVVCFRVAASLARLYAAHHCKITPRQPSGSEARPRAMRNTGDPPTMAAGGR